MLTEINVSLQRVPGKHNCVYTQLRFGQRGVMPNVSEALLLFQELFALRRVPCATVIPRIERLRAHGTVASPARSQSYAEKSTINGLRAKRALECGAPAPLSGTRYAVTEYLESQFRRPAKQRATSGHRAE